MQKCSSLISGGGPKNDCISKRISKLIVSFILLLECGFHCLEKPHLRHQLIYDCNLNLQIVAYPMADPIPFQVNALYQFQVSHSRTLQMFNMIYDLWRRFLNENIGWFSSYWLHMRHLCFPVIGSLSPVHKMTDWIADSSTFHITLLQFYFLELNHVSRCVPM